MAAIKQPREQIPLTDAQILKLLPTGWMGSAAQVLQLVRAVEAQHGIVTVKEDAAK